MKLNMEKGSNYAERGITLIALVITVIILLILAGVAVSISSNSGSIIDKTSQSREEWDASVNQENQSVRSVLAYFAPEAPSGMEKEGHTESSLTVRATGGEKYIYSIDGENWSEEIPDGTPYEITGLNNGQVYTIHTKSINEYGESEETTALMKVGEASAIRLCIGEGYESAPFLGNNTVKRNKIESVTLTNSIAGHSVSDANCWDVSEEKTAEILAWYTDADNDGYYEVTIGQNGGVKANVDSSNLFRDIGNDIEGATINGLEYLDTSNTVKMFAMFRGCKKITSLDLSHFNTNNVIDMSYMFEDCISLGSLDLSNFNTSKVTTMYCMFCMCNGLTSLNISSFNTSNVTTMHMMFAYCWNLTSLNISGFNTGKVETMYAMFYADYKLESLDFSHFNTENVTEFELMFTGCHALTSLDLSSFDTRKAVDMHEMVGQCTELVTIYVGDNWNTDNVTDSTNMFVICRKLVGSIPFDENVVDKTYATTTNGYLTYKAPTN